MPNIAIDGIVDYDNTEYPLLAIVPGVTLNLTLLPTGSTPTASASVAASGQMTLNIGLPQLNNITSLTIDSDTGELSITTSDGQTVTYEGMAQATTEANNAANRANNAAAAIEDLSTLGLSVVNGKVCQTYIKEE